ncbi:G-protein coupled receptor moody-like [Amphiura filiformis]|uniref:G-protein coupled receptor moody-like n=1 Tax=Amphiura filiformis TaxID=82378 RepID=UPI003B21013A
METCCVNTTTERQEERFAANNPVSDVERMMIATLLSMAGTLGITGNTLVISAVLLFKKLRSSTNVFVVNLCIADWITCVNMPWTVLAIVNPENEWPLPDWICVWCGFNLISCIGCSTFTLSLIAFNRLVIITSHAKLYPVIFTKTKMFFMVLFAWIFPLSLATIPLVSDFGDLGYDYKYRTCTWDTANPNSDTYSLLLATAFTPIQFLIIIICYFKIFLFIRGHTKRLHPGSSDTSTSHAPSNDLPTSDTPNDAPGASSLRNALTKRQVKVTKNMFYVVCGFVICLMPFGLSLMISVENVERLVFYSAVFLVSSCFINPIIYCTKHPDFKGAIIKILKCKCRNV